LIREALGPVEMWIGEFRVEFDHPVEARYCLIPFLEFLQQRTPRDVVE
jgi:hypothetical protein